MTGLPSELVLGGNRAVWVWWTAADPRVLEQPAVPGAIPAGVLVDHGDHTMLVPWVPVGQLERFTLLSLLPLAVRELVVCPTCSRAGYISGGAWLPAKDEVQR